MKFTSNNSLLKALMVFLSGSPGTVTFGNAYTCHTDLKTTTYILERLPNLILSGRQQLLSSQKTLEALGN